MSFVEIINEAADQFDLILKFTHRQSSSGAPSADDAHLIRKSSVPVWILDADCASDVDQILVPIKLTADRPDLRNLNERLVHQALTLACAFNARLHFLSAFNTDDADSLRHLSAGQLSSEQIDRIREEIEQVYRNRLQTIADDVMAATKKPELPVPVFESREGEATTLIPDVARSVRADVVVMGSLGRLEVPGLLIGNTAETILPEIRCSVLTVKPSGFRSPVLEWIPMPDRQ